MRVRKHVRVTRCSTTELSFTSDTRPVSKSMRLQWRRALRIVYKRYHTCTINNSFLRRNNRVHIIIRSSSRARSRRIYDVCTWFRIRCNVYRHSIVSRVHINYDRYIRSTLRMVRTPRVGELSVRTRPLTARKAHTRRRHHAKPWRRRWRWEKKKGNYKLSFVVIEWKIVSFRAVRR